MFDWLVLLAPVQHVETPKKDYIGVVAAEAAYAGMLPDAPVVKPLVDTKDCKRCNGVGKIRTGDDQGWTDCPDCEKKNGEMKDAGPMPSMKLQVKPLPPVKTSDCDENGCPRPAA
jgi:hypothetical protein